MRYGIKCEGLAGVPNDDPVVPLGQWLRTGDPDAHAGLGEATFTLSPGRALAFDDALSAMKFWRQQSTVRPTRGDGAPNRPLTAFTVSIEPLPECQHVHYVLKTGVDISGDLDLDLRRAFEKVTCSNVAVVTVEQINSTYPEFNGPIDLCGDHIDDTLTQNVVNTLLKDGTLLDD